MTPQETIAHYRILSKLGEGGMGAVYRATDTKLNRDVAIKVLPDAFAQDPDRMARFAREAQVLASLNHPNIAAIYGIEQNAIVMELVEGDDLKGPLPIDTVLDYARQIAAALEAAHEKGIIHRDLKPANIKVTPDGVVKLLDFGLAKAAEDGARVSGNPAMSPTLSLTMTQAGMILGTAAYMSPEQARGKPVDKRADIWAFGVLLFEMLAGRSLFGGGETVTDALASVVKEEPQWSALPSETPPRIRRLIERCLRKDPKLRLRDIGEARLAIDEAEPPSPVAVAAAKASGSKAPLAIAAGVLLAAAAVLGFGWWRATRPAPRPIMRLSVDLGPGASPNIPATALISPDGTRLLFHVRGADGKRTLAIRQLDHANTILLPSDGTSEFFSPDSLWVGFAADGKLQKVPVQGGGAVAICDAPGARGAAWGADGNIIIGTNRGLMRVPASGGVPQPVSRNHQGRDHFPDILPGGKAVLITNHQLAAEYEIANIVALSLESGESKTLIEGGFYGRYLASGHIVYVNEGKLFAVGFDPGKLALRGAPAAVIDDLASVNTEGAGQFDVSNTGTLVYRSGKSAQNWPVAWMDAAGKTIPVISREQTYGVPRLSPDGKKLAMAIRGPKGYDYWIYDLERGTPTQLTFDAPGNFEIVWAPDGKHVVFGHRTEPQGLFYSRSDGSGAPHRLIEGSRAQSFTPDGKRLAYRSGLGLRSGTGVGGIFSVPLDLTDPDRPKAGNPELLFEQSSTSFQIDVEFSPDGRWVAYASNESGQEQTFVRPFPGPGGKWRISTDGGKFPRWSRTARELFFVAPDRRIMVADYTVKGDEFISSKPRVWSEQRIVHTGIRPNYDLAPDGKRVIMFPRAESQEEAGPPHVTFVLNFFDELRRRVQ